jgi:hypothetical protein
MHNSKHAGKRCQQRAINRYMLELLWLFGVETAQKGGSYEIHIPSKELADIKRAIKSLNRSLDQLDGIYAIESIEGLRITVGHMH